MRVNMPTVIMAVIAVGLCAAFLGFRCSLSSSRKKDEQKHAEEVKPQVQVASSSQQVPPLPPAVEKLNAVQKEIAALSDEEIVKQSADIRSQIHKANLVDRLNHDQVTDKERQDANELLARLALLGVEKAKRGSMKDKKHDEDMAKMKE